MRKVALLAAVALSAVFANTSSSVAATDEDVANLNKNTFLFLQGPFGAAAQAAPAAAPAAGAKVAKKKKSKK